MEDPSRQEKASSRWCASELLIFQLRVNWHIWGKLFFPPSPGPPRQLCHQQPAWCCCCLIFFLFFFLRLDIGCLCASQAIRLEGRLRTPFVGISRVFNHIAELLLSIRVRTRRLSSQKMGCCAADETSAPLTFLNNTFAQAQVCQLTRRTFARQIIQPWSLTAHEGEYWAPRYCPPKHAWGLGEMVGSARRCLY